MLYMYSRYTQKERAAKKAALSAFSMIYRGFGVDGCSLVCRRICIIDMYMIYL